MVKASQIIGSILLLMALPSPLVGQGLADLLDRATLVVEARPEMTGTGGNAVYRTAIRRVIKGPAGLGKVQLFLPTRVSAHKKARPGQWSLLFLHPIGPGGNKVYGINQATFGAISLAGNRNRAVVAYLERLVQLTGQERARTREIFRQLTSPNKLLQVAAAVDLETVKRIRMLPPEAATLIGQLLATLSPANPTSKHLIHIIGEMRPANWTHDLLQVLRKEKGEILAGQVGVILATRLGSKALEILSREYEQSPRGSHLLALGATRLPGALSLLSKGLTNGSRWIAAARGLSLHRTDAACRILVKELGDCQAGKKKKALALVGFLANYPRPLGRRIVREIGRGERLPHYKEMARGALKGR